MKQLNNPIAYPLILGALLVLVIVLFFAFQPSQQTRQIVEENEQEVLQQDQEAVLEPVSVFEYLTPEEWEYTARAEEQIESLAEGQVITFGIVQDPDQESVFYFASNVFDEEEEANLVSVYTFDTNGLRWQRLYRGTFGAGDFTIGALNDDVIPMLHVLGFVREEENGPTHLVVLAQDIKDAPGPCADPYLIGTPEPPTGVRALIEIPIDTPYELRNHTPIAEIVTERSDQQEACLSELFS